MGVDDGDRIDGETQMDPISPDLRTVANLEDGDWKALGPGESILQLDDSLRIGTGFHVYRLEPGASSTPHEHACDEHFLVLDGDLVDHDGFRYGPGDMVMLRRGTRHNSRTETGCTIAVFIATPEVNL